MSLFPMSRGLFTPKSRGDKEKGPSDGEMEYTSLAQSCTIFSSVPLNVSECQKHCITILRALFKSHKFSREDLDSIFIAMTQAYHNKDLLLHRLIFLILRHLTIDPAIVVLITQSLSTDMSSDLLMNRARAVRLLPYLLKVDTQKEPLIKQALLSRVPIVSSSGLACCLTLCFQGESGRVRKFVSELSAASQNGSPSSQFLSFLILYYVRQGDGNMLRKMVDQRRDSLTSSLTSHIVIQISSETHTLTGYDASEKLIVSKLQSSSTATQLDAVRAILSNPKSAPETIAAAVTRLNSMLMLPANVTMFAALRTIGEHAASHRDEFSRCNTVLERILNNTEGTLSALAAVALLHTGFESTIDRVLPSIGNFATKLSFDQQAALLRSCVEVTRRHPAKLETVLSFIWTTFRHAENLQVHGILVEGFFSFAESIAGAQAPVLKYLCEYIEDSKFTALSVMIINFVGRVALEPDVRGEVVRCLCNRLFLEGAEIRAATIDALFNFVGDDRLGASVRSVIRRHLADVDDEVRDRATFYTVVMENGYDDLLALDAEVEAKPVEPVAPPVEVREGLLFESEPIKATDENEEFLVSYVAQAFVDRVVLVFTVKNTLSFAVTDVSVRRMRAERDFVPIEATVCDEIAADSEGTITLTYEGAWSDPQMIGSFECSILFRLVDDPDEDGEYKLPNGAPLKIAAFMKPTKFTDFEAGFAALNSERIERVKFPEARSHGDVVKIFTDAVGLSVVEPRGGTDAPKENVVVNLAGLAFGSELVLARLIVHKALRGGVPVEIFIRSNSEPLLEAVLRSLFE